MIRQELPIDQKVVDDTAVGVAHHAVEDLAGLEAADVVGKDMVDESLGFRTFHKDLAHVGDIEHAHLLADGEVLLGNAVVLDRHHETGEGAHLGAQRDMPVIEAGLLERSIGDFF